MDENNIKIICSSDCDYEKLVIEIFYNNKFIDRIFFYYISILSKIG